MSRKLKRELNPETIFKLNKIFLEKKWDIEDDENYQVSLFNRFCELLSGLKTEEQELTLELTERFTIIKFEDYLMHINIAIDNLLSDDTVNLDVTKYYIAPLIAPKDIGKSKSSIMVHYSLKGQVDYINNFSGNKSVLIDDLEVNSNKINQNNSLLLLVDDFIGTGETASLAINYLINEKGIKREKIVVLSIASLNQGISRLSEMGINHYSSLTFGKGITDFYSNPREKDAKLQIMKGIEGKINVHKNERLGYMKSEALIRLIRTPNNTFPVFWKEKGGRIAPFPR